MTLKFVDIGRDQARINIAALDCDGVILGVMDGNVVNPFWQQQADQTLACGKLLGLYDFYEKTTPLRLLLSLTLYSPTSGKLSSSSTRNETTLNCPNALQRG